MTKRYKLDPDRIERLCTAMRAGNTRQVACDHAGIHLATLHRWLTIGRDGKHRDLKSFYEAFTQAEKDAEMLNVAVIQTAARPREVVSVTTAQRLFSRKSRTLYPDGRVVEETKPEVVTLESVTRTKDFDWKAAAWWLERRHHKEWRQRKDVDLSTLSDGQLQSLLEVSFEGGSEAQGSEPSGTDPAI